LIITSPPGKGKTYLCSALTDFMMEKGYDVYGITERDFRERMRRTMESGGEYHRAIKLICDHQFLIYDDLGSTGEGPTNFREETTLALIDERYEMALPTIFTSNIAPHEFSKYFGARAASRLRDKENTIIELPDEAIDFRAEGINHS